MGIYLTAFKNLAAAAACLALVACAGADHMYAGGSKPSSELALLMVSPPVPSGDLALSTRIDYVNGKPCSLVISRSGCNALVLVESGWVSFRAVVESGKQQAGSPVAWKPAESTYASRLEGGHVYTYEAVRMGADTASVSVRKVCRSNDLHAVANSWYGRGSQFSDYIVATRGKPYSETDCSAIGRPA